MLQGECEIDVVGAGAHHRDAVGHRACGLARHDDRPPAAHQLAVPIEAQRPADDRDPQPFAPRRPVVLVSGGARAHQHHVGEVAKSGEHGAVAPSTERSGAAVDGGGAVSARDHAHEHPRASVASAACGVRVRLSYRHRVTGIGMQAAHGPGILARRSRHGDLGGSGPRWGTLVRMTEVPTRTAIRTCPFCEAGCGLEITLRDEEIVRVRGDRDDVFSHGFICPKGSTLKQLHEDPDRLRRPLVKRNGEFVEVSWEEAFAEIERRLVPIMETHGRDAVATYIGNPTAHNLSAMLYARDARAGDRDPHAVLSRHGGPGAEAGRRGLHVRHRSERARARHGSQRLHDDLGREPLCVERQSVHRAGLPGPPRSAPRSGREDRRCRPPQDARPRRRPTSGSRSCPAPTRTSSWRSCTRSSTRGLRTRETTSGRGSTAGPTSSRSPPSSRPNASRTRAASTLRRSGGSPASSRRHRPRPCTDGSASARRSSARWPRGWSTSSTS